MSDSILPLILHPQTGTPFKSVDAATQAMRKKGLDADSHLIVPHMGGHAILDVSRLQADFFHLDNGKPFPALNDAQTFRVNRMLSEERARPVKWNGGWALLSMDAIANPAGVVDVPAPKAKPAAMTYSLVEFDDRYPGSPEPERVVLALGNRDLVLQLQRGVPVVVPDPMLQIADNATYRKITHKEHEGRKVGARVRRCGYKKIRDATEAEFKMFVEQGQKALEEYLKAEVAPPQTLVEA
jgi:hypothetical protein